MKSELRSFLAALVFVALVSIPARAQTHTGSFPDETGVYEAVLGLMDRIPLKDPHVTIFGMTLNDKCGEEAYPFPLANGCTFLWIKPDDAHSINKLLHQEWPDFQDSTWSDFEAKSATSVRLQEPIATPWKHKLIFPGDGPSKGWGNPNLTIFLSRVGFNPKKTEAVVYVLTFSYMDQVDTAGDYFLFRVGKTGRWEPNGRVTYFDKDKGQDQ